MADYTNIDRPYDSVSNRIPGGTSPVINEISSLFNQPAEASSSSDPTATGTNASSDSSYVGTQGTATVGGSVETQQVNTGQSLPDLYITTFIRSNNFKAGAIGFNINGQTGSAEFNNVLIRGTVFASVGQIGGWTINLGSISSTNIVLDSANDRIQVGSGTPYILIDGSAASIGTSDFVSGQKGWNITADGTAEFNNIVARGELHSTVFTKDSISATGGSFVVLTASTLLNDFTSVTSPATSTMDIKDDPSGHVQLFSVNDILRIKDGVGLDNWLKVTAVTDNLYYFTYTVQKQSGSNGTFTAGCTVVDYKQSADGSILLTSDLTNAPYIDIATNGATPWSGTVEKARLGNLSGITDPVFGALSGYGIYTQNGYFNGALMATSGRIGSATNYWSIATGSLTAVGGTSVSINYGKTSFVDTTTGFWLGTTSGVSQFNIGSSTNYISWNGSSLNILGGTLTTGASGQYMVISAVDNSFSFFDTSSVNFMIMGSSGGTGAINITPTAIRNNGLTVNTSQSGVGYTFTQNANVNSEAIQITDNSTTNNLSSITMTYKGTASAIRINNYGSSSALYVTSSSTGDTISLNLNGATRGLFAYNQATSGSTDLVFLQQANLGHALSLEGDASTALETLYVSSANSGSSHAGVKFTKSGGGSPVLEIDQSSSSAFATGILMNIQNSGDATAAVAFEFDGEEIQSLGVSVMATKRIHISVGGHDYYIPIYSS